MRSTSNTGTGDKNGRRPRRRLPASRIFIPLDACSSRTPGPAPSFPVRDERRVGSRIVGGRAEQAGAERGHAVVQQGLLPFLWNWHLLPGPLHAPDNGLLGGLALVYGGDGGSDLNI